MVFYFLSNVSPGYVLYMGLDKFENEELIKWGWSEDVWFHVDKLSSAHVYLRLHDGDTLDSIPQAVIDDCAQLVKANSIQGNKQNNLDVVYTMHDNLKKTNGMEVGQVGFYKDKDVHKVRVERRINEIVNRLNKTKTEKETAVFISEKEQHDRNLRENAKDDQRKEKDRQKEVEKRKREEAELRSYSDLHTDDKMKTNYDSGNDSDDFM